MRVITLKAESWQWCVIHKGEFVVPSRTSWSERSGDSAPNVVVQRNSIFAAYYPAGVIPVTSELEKLVFEAAEDGTLAELQLVPTEGTFHLSSAVVAINLYRRLLEREDPDEVKLTQAITGISVRHRASVLDVPGTEHTVRRFLRLLRTDPPAANDLLQTMRQQDPNGAKALEIFRRRGPLS